MITPTSDYDEVAVLRLRQECDRLRAENAALRPLVSELQHKLRTRCQHCEFHPDQPNIATETLIRKNREHG